MEKSIQNVGANGADSGGPQDGLEAEGYTAHASVEPLGQLAKDLATMKDRNDELLRSSVGSSAKQSSTLADLKGLEDRVQETLVMSMRCDPKNGGSSTSDASVTGIGSGTGNAQIGSSHTDRMNHSVTLKMTSAAADINNSDGDNKGILDIMGPTFGWRADDTLSNDENLLDLALTMTRASTVRAGHMASIATSPQGDIIASAINSSIELGDVGGSGRIDVHAEVNLLGAMSRAGIPTDGLHIVITMPPCRRCFVHIQAAGFTRILTRQPVDDEKIVQCCQKNGIEIVVVPDTEARSIRRAQLVRDHLGR